MLQTSVNASVGAGAASTAGLAKAAGQALGVGLCESCGGCSTLPAIMQGLANGYQALLWQKKAGRMKSTLN